MTPNQMVSYMEAELELAPGFILPLPSDIRAVTSIEWDPVPQELYDPLNFHPDDVPPMFGIRYPVVIFNSYLWIYVNPQNEDDVGSYFKFTPHTP